jgi:N-acetylglucosamine-6-phosphate deacetylase
MRLGVTAALVGGRLVPGDVEVVDGTVAGVGLASPNGRDRGIAVPGFVDLQVNGFAGVDFLHTDANGYRQAGDALLETGVTAYLPTFITAPEDDLLAAIDAVTPGPGARILGIHLEGPFLSPVQLGTHPPAARRDPDATLLERLLGAGRVRLVTLAPELPGAEELIDLCIERGVVVSCGHSDATAAQAAAALDRGARAVTHVFNAMRPLRHRDPGIAGAALTRDDVVVQMIVDGVHLAPETAALVWRAARGRVALVTDAIAGAGLGDGGYRIGGIDVDVANGVARGPGGVLAGSTLTLIDAVRNLHALGATMEEAVGAATSVPAGLVAASEVGRLDVGLPADIVVLTDELQIDRVLVGGEALVVC